MTRLASLTILALVSSARAQFGKPSHVVPDGMVEGGQFIGRFPQMKPNARDDLPEKADWIDVHPAFTT